MASADPNTAAPLGCVALTTFCELHGPAIVLCTQMVPVPCESSVPSSANPLSPPLSAPAEAPPLTDLHRLAAVAAASASSGLPRSSQPSIGTACTPIPTSGMSSTHPYPLATQSSTTPSISTSGAAANSTPLSPSTSPPSPIPTSSCPGCLATFESIPLPASLAPSVPRPQAAPGEAKGYVSVDERSQTAFFTGRNPYYAKTYASVRQACVRSLSIEQHPGKEGPIMFGDSTNGYVLSYMFKIRDSQARGFYRCYTFLLLHRDYTFLTSSWPFISNKFRMMAAEMQAQAEVTFSRERLSSDAVAQHSYQQQLLSSSFRSNSFSPSSGEIVFRRRANQPLRILTELLDKPDLFAYLHLHNSWLLKAFHRRVFEALAEGRELIGTFDSNMISDLDPRVLREMGRLTGDAETEANLSRSSTPQSQASNRNDVNASDSAIETEYPVKPQAAIAPILPGRAGEYRDKTANRGDGHARSSTQSIPPTLLKLFEDQSALTIVQFQELLGSSNFIKLLYNLMTGNQIVIRGDNPTMVSSIFSLLQEFLPSACASRLDYSAEYEESWKYNLLGMPRRVGIPPNIERNHIVELELKPKRGRGSTNLIGDYECDLISGEMPPTTARGKVAIGVLGDLEPILISSQNNMSDHAIRNHIVFTKEAWINKTKLFYCFVRLGRAEDMQKLSGFLAAIGAGVNDLPILRYWTKGLGHEHRQKLLQKLRR